MSRRLQPLLFLVIAITVLLAWQWAGDGPSPVGEGGAQAPQVTTTGDAPGVAGPDVAGRGLDGSPTTNPTTSPERPSAPARGAAPLPDFLPEEAADTLALIVRNGPFPYRQDGAVFQNRERRLPQQPRGYYREYTVRTPGSRDRGARRIVTGGGTGDAPPVEYYYTADHYRSFRPFAFDPVQVTR